MKKQHLILLIIVSVSAIVFYFQYKCYVPTSDDMYYQFICNDANQGYTASQIGEGTQYINSFSDVFTSMNWFYNHINGRYMVHVAVQTCVSMMSPNTFAVINALFYALFLLMVYRLSIKFDKKTPIIKFLVCVAGAWLLIPFQGNTFLGGVATTVNYLWSGVFTLSFLILHDYLLDKKTQFNIFTLLSLFIYGAFVGSLQESFSIGLAGSFFVYMLLKRKQLTRTEWYLILGLFLGTAFCVFAPGNMIRLSGQGTAGGSSSFLMGCLSSWAVDAFLLTVLMIWFSNRELLKKTLINSSFLLGILLFNSLFCMIIAYIGRHQLICISMCSLIIMFRLWFGYANWSSLAMRCLASVLVIATIVSNYFIYNIRMERYESFTKFCEVALSKPSCGYVTCREYDDVNYTVGNNPLICYYYVGLMPFVGNGLKRSLSLSLSKGKDLRLLDNLYPDDPSVIASECIPSNKVADNIYRVFNNNYVVVLSSKVPTNHIHATMRIERKAFFLADTEETISPGECFEWNHHYYYILGNRGCSSAPIIGVNKLTIES